MNQLSNAEFMLLQIIAESQQASGYQINKLIELRGYRDWANIGTTSVYAGLQKLKDKQLIRSEDSGHKSGKGPLPSTYAITTTGMEALRNETVISLSATRERDNRFDLGLAALPFIGKEEAIEALRQRQSFLGEKLQQLKTKYESQGGDRLPLHIRALFLHPVNMIGNEKNYIADLIRELEAEAKEHV